MIRLATEEDTFDLLVLTKNFMKEAGGFFRFSKDKVETFLKSSLGNPDSVIIVAEHDGQVVGMLIGFVTEHPFIDTRVATEIGFYVSPEHRGGRKAIRLAKAFEEWAMSKSADDLVLGDVKAIKDLSGFYNKLGYTPTEGLYVKDLTNGRA